MYYYELSTEKDQLRTSGIFPFNEKENILLMHKESYTKEEFYGHVKIAYENALRYDPNRLRKTAQGESHLICFEHLLKALKELFGYEEIQLQTDLFLPKFSHSGTGQKHLTNYVKNIFEEKENKKEAKKGKKSSSKNPWGFLEDDDLDDLW